MKKMMLLLVVVAFVVGSALAAVAADAPKTVTFEAKMMGNVTFDHAMHMTKADCKHCHHKGVEAGACRACHDGKTAPKAKTVFHKVCKDCHKKEGVSTSCKVCHKK